MYILTVTHGPDQGKKIQLKDGQRYTIGANAGDSLALADPKALDGHCSIRVVGRRLILENHTASAGTWIGDRKVAKVELKVGMTFRVGDTHLKLTATAAPASPAPAAAAAAEPDPLIGKIIGGYKINEVVGAGGMGTVYKATQLSLHREIALKILRRKLAKDPAFVDLFVHEARAAAQLADPNIVQVYDAGTEGEICYFAMEFIGAGSVEELLARTGKLPWEEAILMVLEAAHGLKYAEGKGIVHRDVKPDNLMINDDGRIKILDLGLAKRGEGKQDQGIIGTPHFIPPEQALGKDVDVRADIYSLGATFFRMITGRTLFSGKTAKEIVLKHIKEPPPAASSVEKSVPDELDMVLARMLAKDPDDRFANTAELISALETICAHHGIKGAIIRKGLSKKVLIPIAVLVAAAIGVAIHFATRDPVFIEDVDSKEKAAERAKQLAEAQKRMEAQKREARKLKADSALQSLQLKAARLPSIEETYDEPAKAADREAAWTEMAKEFREFAATKDATEFGRDIDANKAADKIEKDLEGYKSVQEDKREWIDAQLKAAQTVDTEQRKKLRGFQLERHYGDAVNLAERLGRDKPAKDDPFEKIAKGEWVSPLDASFKVSASRVPRIMAVIKKARENMRKEHDVIPGDATQVWNDVKAQATALGNAEVPKDEDVEKVIAACRNIEARFPAQNGATPEPIAELVKAAKATRKQWETHLAEARAKRLAQDRMIVRNTLRKQRSLDPGAIPNLVMECDIAAAIDNWQQRLDRNELLTEPYKTFAKEQIRMLRWVDYLFWRFHADLKASLSNKSDAPFATLTVDMPPAQRGGRPVQDRFARPGDGDHYKFWINKKYKGDKEVRFGQMPMDWVYHAAFHHRGSLRWEKPQPVIVFALGVFCMETMQFDLAVKHFEKLTEDERYGKAATLLLARAKAESAALIEYRDTIMAVLNKPDAKAADVKAALQALDTFHTRHEGTLFYLDVMKRREPIRKDVYGLVVPNLPAAPPR